jgi:gliding motility-associated-like protein
VILKLPTAFTPYDKDGWNDVFMERHYIIIFDRYGQKIFEGNDGWDGTFKGAMADPGVYYYVVTMTDGSIRKGTVEIIFLRK